MAYNKIKKFGQNKISNPVRNSFLSGADGVNVPMYNIVMGKEERSAVGRVLLSGKLAQGEIVEEFEKKFAKFIGVKYACAVSNGTVALELALKAANIGQGDEVITTPFTFIATANAILHVGARPVFTDIDEKTFNINPELLEKKITKRTKAILPVHLYGLPADMDKINKIARRHNLVVIEDACQAHGAELNGRKAGALGLAGCFSFYPTKNMTTGEGGMVTTNSTGMAKRMRLLRNHGMRVRYRHEIVGYNLRMTEIQAAIGLEQLKKFPSLLARRRRNALFLSQALKDAPGIIIPNVPKNKKHAWHQYTIRIKKTAKSSREKLIKKLNGKNIQTAIYYDLPIHLQKAYLKMGYGEKFPVAEKLAREVLSIPVNPYLAKTQLNYLAAQIKS